MLLVERFGLIKDVLWEIWEEMPNTGLVSVLHRLLDFYAEMAVKRREVDRARKRPKTPRGTKNRQDIENLPTREESRSEFDEIGNHFRELHRVTCKCSTPDWRSFLKEREQDCVTIGFHCHHCNTQRTRKVTFKQFEEVARSLCRRSAS